MRILLTIDSKQKMMGYRRLFGMLDLCVAGVKAQLVCPNTHALYINNIEISLN